MNWLELISQLAGSEAGEAASSMDKAEAMRLIRAAVDDMGKINVPKLQQLFLERMPKSQLGNIQDDPEYRTQQGAADAQLNDVINSGGLTLSDKAALNAIRNKSARTESAGRNQILNGMAARGTLDSGAQLATQLQGNQQSANELAAADESTAGRAEARTFEAIRERARNAEAGLDRDYRQKSDAARANDAINAANASIANAANTYNAGIPQKNFNNELELAKAKAGPGYALAGANAANAKDTQQKWEGYGKLGAAAAHGSGSSSSSGSSGLGYDDAAGKTASSNTFDSGTTDTNNDSGGWNDYPGDALSGQSTKDPDIVGYDANGKPIRRSSQGQNF